MRSKGTILVGAILAATLAGIVLAQSYDPGTELTLVEKLTKARDDYKASLTELYNFYLRSGDAGKSNRAYRELKAFGSIETYEYATGTAGTTGQGAVKVLEYNPVADDYYTDGEIFAGSNRKATRDLALKRFEKILTAWPTSDKAPSAAFQMGEVYAGLYYRDYELAAKYYMKAYELDPATSLPALLEAGNMLYKVQRFAEAVEAYKLAVKGSRDVKVQEKAQAQLDKLARMGY